MNSNSTPYPNVTGSLPPWQEILANTIRTTDKLCRLLEIDRQALPDTHPLVRQFPVRVPAPYLAKIKKGDPEDPLLQQVFPDIAEANEAPGYSADPLQESAHNPQPGILHKYKGRALLIATSSCAVHCRYCFRRHFPYSDNPPGKEGWKTSLDYIRQDTSIQEVIFSGGDPLTLPDSYLQWYLYEISTIPHVTRIRLHTRLPVMIPQRINKRLCELLENSRFQTILVLHSNHPQELDDDTNSACQALKAAGVTLLNQSVLLRGVNDDADTLIRLSERLFADGVMPYYLHLMDRVEGGAHFTVSDHDAGRLLAAMQQNLPGYLVPKLVREEPGKKSKTVVL
jgi:EF-P beta-lysylation protein EpmB